MRQFGKRNSEIFEFPEDLPERGTNESIVEVTYKMIKTMLMRGDLAPGQEMIVRPFAERLEVSATPVREALLQLASEQLLVTVRNKSIRVPLLSISELIELRAIRLNLEIMATENAIPNISQDAIDRMREIHTKLMASKLQGNRSEVLHFNYLFHFEMYKAAEMPHLLGMLGSLWARTGPPLRDLYRPPIFHMPGRHPHDELLDALDARDLRGAVDAIKSDVAGHGKALFDKIVESDEMMHRVNRSLSSRSRSMKADRVGASSPHASAHM